MTKDKAVMAEWAEGAYEFSIGDHVYRSIDGFEWLDSCGNPADDEQFYSAIVTFVGGPLDGEIFC
jgi:hypothetical protein